MSDPAAMTERPEYIRCIADTHEDHKGRAWCGAPLAGGFHFESFDHAALNARAGGRLVACPQCVAAVVIAMGYDR